MLTAEQRKGIVVPALKEAQAILERDLGDQRMRYGEFIYYRGLYDRLALKPDGVHDIYHAGRVLIYGGNLARWEAKEGKNIKVREVEMFAPHHDRLRNHDGYDWLHGCRAALALRKQFAGENLDLDYFLLEKLLAWHVLPDSLTPPLVRETPEMQIAKDADALDRFRNGGDLNLNYLRLKKKSPVLVPLAKELHDRTEARRGELIHPLEIVAQEAFAIGLVIQ